MSSTILYGIKNCDTVRKARKWLEAQGIDYRFHDFRGDGLDATNLEAWSQAVGWETLLNRRGTTWRQLPDSDKENINRKKAIQLMLDQPSLIKRPVLIHKKQTYVGFSANDYLAIFK